MLETLKFVFCRDGLDFELQREGGTGTTGCSAWVISAEAIEQQQQLPFLIVQTRGCRCQTKPRPDPAARPPPLPNIGEASCISRPAMYRHKAKITYTSLRITGEEREKEGLMTTHKRLLTPRKT